jgi:hypothetical protein
MQKFLIPCELINNGTLEVLKKPLDLLRKEYPEEGSVS